VDVRLLRFSGLHRFRPIHADFWYANIPEETRYFLTRKHRVVVVREHGPGRRPVFRPFAILLLQSIKKHPRQLCYVALDFVHANARHLSGVLPAPAWDRHSRKLWDFAAIVAIGATLALLLAHRWKTSLFPVRDPRL